MWKLETSYFFECLNSFSPSVLSGTTKISGCVELLKTIRERVRPSYHLYGHIHEDYGIRSDGTTTYINAAYAGDHHKSTDKPIVFDNALPKGQSKWLKIPEKLYFSKVFTRNKKTKDWAFAQNAALVIQWCSKESLRVLFYEAKVPNSDGNITI